MGEDWTEEMEEAWKELWGDTCKRLLTLTNEVLFAYSLCLCVLEGLGGWQRGSCFFSLGRGGGTPVTV